MFISNQAKSNRIKEKNSTVIFSLALIEGKTTITC